MSQPANRLSGYRSYSYYHVLALCDSSATASSLANSTSVDVWQHADSTSAPLGRYSPKDAPSGQGKYCILVNGSTDSTFVITTARWQSATAASATQSDRNTSVAIEGSLSISEPKGVVFLDQMVKCCAELGVDAATAVFVLKTFFIGFGNEPSVGDFIDNINDLAPLQFIAYDVTGSFTEQGGMYEMQFVSCVNGATRLPQYSKASTGFSFTAGATLKDTLKTLERVITQNYQTYYNCVYEQVKQSAIAAGQDPSSIVQNLRRVTYRIDVGGVYDTNATSYTVTDQPEQAKDFAGCDQPAKITFPPSTSIEDAIHRIMMMSPRVKKDMSEGDPSDHKKYEYKIHTAVLSTPSGGDSQQLEYTVYYRVERFLRPKDVALSFDAFANGNPEADPSIARNVIHFDYMYTGKNTDILEFDMKVNMGLAYLQVATLSNTFKSQLEPAPMRVTIPSAPGQTQLTRGGKLVQVPVFFGSQIRTPAYRNTQNPSDTVQAAYTLAQHASIEAAEATMKIIGNTNLLGTVNATTSPERLVTRGAVSVDTTVDTQEADFSDWGFVPSFVKVKIKMPRNNDDISLLTGASDSTQTSPGDSRDYAQDFWFDGYYYVYGIDHVFEGGEFTQTLQMLGIPQSGIIKQQSGTASQELDFTQRVNGCFDNDVGCGSKQVSGAAPQTKVPTIAEPVNGNTSPPPTTRHDAETINTKAATPSDVEGWQTRASPDVRDAILKASAVKGVDSTILAQIASIESSFGTNNVASTSTARGLFQFVEKTWMGLVRSGKIPDIQPATTRAEALPKRDVPLYNAYGGAQYVVDNQRQIAKHVGWSGPEAVSAGDTYLGHFLGAGGAIAVIRGDASSGGHMTVRDAYILQFGQTSGIKEYNLAKTSNPQWIADTTTVGDIRNKAAVKMANTLKFKPTARVANAVAANTTTASQSMAACRDCDASKDKSAANQSPCNQAPTPTATPPQSATTVDYVKHVDEMGNQTGF